MKRLCIIASALLSVGCPPPDYVDIFNNTGDPLEVRAFFFKLHSLDPGQKARFKVWALFDRFVGPDEDGRHWPILGIKVNDRCVDYRFEALREAWLPRDGGTRGVFVQVDPNLAVRYTDLNDERPITTEKSQPVGWPLRPQPPLQATVEGSAYVTFFRTNGGGNMSVFVDDERVAFLPKNRYFTISLDPGQALFNADGYGNDPITVELKSGRQYYVRVYKRRWAVGEDVEVVDEKGAEKAIGQCSPISCEFSFDGRVHQG